MTPQNILFWRHRIEQTKEANLLPQPIGLYDPRFEKDNCGIGFVAHLSGNPSHEMIERALESLCNLEHRGAIGGDGASGDGAGIMVQIPQPFFASEMDQKTKEPLAVGVFFFPQDEPLRQTCIEAVEQTLSHYQLSNFVWRNVPTHSEFLGDKAKETCPVIRHLLLEKPANMDQKAFERQLYLIRKRIEATVIQRDLLKAKDPFYITSMSSKTMVYKGLMLANDIGKFYSDLQQPEFKSAIAVFHQRYSTNTFPTWTRAQPFRMLCHNGEINTIAGNANWTMARQGTMDQSEWGKDSQWLNPVIDFSGSDSSMLDNTVELLVQSGRDLPHALMMLVPEAWEGNRNLDRDRRAFYQYHASLSEPWDGPAGLTFTDGTIVGTTLDRNGLRPCRYSVTSDGWVSSASEDGAIVFDESTVEKRGKLGPGQMVLANVKEGVLWEDGQIKAHYAQRKPYAMWLDKQQQTVQQTEVQQTMNVPENLTQWQRVFGYGSEDISITLRPMGNTGHEPVGSMGDDAPPAALSAKVRPLYHFFKQRFAQVTNPAIDSLRESRVMSLNIRMGRRPTYLEESEEHANFMELESPILHQNQFLQIQATAKKSGKTVVTLPTTFSAKNPNQSPTELRKSLETLASDAERAAINGAEILILSDRLQDKEQAPIPALLALGAVHHHLTEVGQRMQVSLIVECGDAREVHHIACLIGCGAEAVFPYLALKTVYALAVDGKIKNSPPRAVAKTVTALEKGLLKTMAKMGIATVNGYHGAQIFQTLGLHSEVIDLCFKGIPARLGNVDLEQIAQGVLKLHQAAYAEDAGLSNEGLYRFKPNGERHAFTPISVRTLHEAVEMGADAFEKSTSVDEVMVRPEFREAYKTYRTFAQPLNECGENGEPLAIRDLLTFKPDREPVDIKQVESVSSILKRFSTGAMSHGSLSDEAHRALAIAMNRLGAKSNSGEGGEHPDRFDNLQNSRIKQVASGRFGVTATYLTSADELQIKIAQGAKPGEGGQLPGHKVSVEIAMIRHTMPGVALISPPPHHDIYSIEDLAQLIYDLKQVNPKAKVSVKLVAETGVGIVAAGVAKGYADVVHIAGHNGGTGSSPLNSIKNAGEPWELGLAETQQTLLLNDLRGRVTLRTDGGLQTGRDVLVAMLLGADEVSFGTASLVAIGCLMARQCHANTCPVGIATQDLKLREKFLGKPEALMAYMCFIAQEVRERLATLGHTSLEDVVGRVDLLTALGDAESAPVALTQLLTDVDPENKHDRRNTQPRNELPKERTLGHQLHRDACDIVGKGGTAKLSYSIKNTDRSVGVQLAGAVALCHGTQGLTDAGVIGQFTGQAGGSFGAFMPQGIKLKLSGVANDYVGKGLCGGDIVIAPDPRSPYRDQSHQHAIIGNTVLYGATSGRLFAAGRAGERFCVRNSGVTAVVEGVGAHGCEYMTGGTVVILGNVGDNFGAGMTGGKVYVFDEHNRLPTLYNTELIQIKRPNDEEPELKALLKEHLEETNSARASWLLNNWANVLPGFWVVTPLADAAEIEASNEGAAGKATVGASKN